MVGMVMVMVVMLVMVVMVVMVMMVGMGWDWQCNMMRMIEATCMHSSSRGEQLLAPETPQHCSPPDQNHCQKEF